MQGRIDKRQEAQAARLSCPLVSFHDRFSLCGWWRGELYRQCGPGEELLIQRSEPGGVRVVRNRAAGVNEVLGRRAEVSVVGRPLKAQFDHPPHEPRQRGYVQASYCCIEIRGRGPFHGHLLQRAPV